MYGRYEIPCYGFAASLQPELIVAGVHANTVDLPQRAGRKPLNALTSIKRDSVMVFQSCALLSPSNIFDDMAYRLKPRKFDKPIIREKDPHIPKLVAPEGMEGRMTNHGQQCVALTFTLVLEPGILPFDEPLPPRIPSSGYPCAP